MTKQQLAEALARAKQMAADREMLVTESIARAFGYLEQAVARYVETDTARDREERKKLARHGIRY